MLFFADISFSANTLSSEMSSFPIGSNMLDCRTFLYLNSGEVIFPVSSSALATLLYIRDLRERYFASLYPTQRRVLNQAGLCGGVPRIESGRVRKHVSCCFSTCLWQNSKQPTVVARSRTIIRLTRKFSSLDDFPSS